jgi:hypothetical protein
MLHRALVDRAHDIEPAHAAQFFAQVGQHIFDQPFGRGALPRGLVPGLDGECSHDAHH